MPSGWRSSSTGVAAENPDRPDVRSCRSTCGKRIARCPRWPRSSRRSCAPARRRNAATPARYARGRTRRSVSPSSRTAGRRRAARAVVAAAGVSKDVQVPMGAALLTMAVDVRDERLEVLVVGWGRGRVRLVDHHMLPATRHRSVLGRARRAARPAVPPRVRRAPGVSGTCIDSAGHRTTMVYDYALRHAARRVYAIIGRDGERPIISAPSPRRWGRNQRRCRSTRSGSTPRRPSSPAAEDDGGRARVHPPADGRLVR